MTAINVLADPQYGLARVLNPQAGFENIYNTKSGAIPVAFPGVLDPQAGQPGYASNLLAGLAVPIGASVKIWIPTAIDDYTPVLNYEYMILWRFRSQKDFNDAVIAGRKASPYNLPAPQIGYADSASKRMFLPGASENLLYEQTEPIGAGLPGLIVVRSQLFRPSIITTTLPLISPTNEGIWQQGTYQDTGNNPNPGGPSYMILDVEAQSNEMSIWAFKVDREETWDFATTDKAFSNTYGTNNNTRANDPNIGIIVVTGVR